MTSEQIDQTVVSTGPAVAPAPEVMRTDSRRVIRTGPSGAEIVRRVAVLLFGLIQIVIGLRVVLLVIGAREGNLLVAGILNVSQVFVAPFAGILGTDSLHGTGSMLDVTAIVAFVGWTILELIVLWAIGIFRREAA